MEMMDAPECRLPAMIDTPAEMVATSRNLTLGAMRTFMAVSGVAALAACSTVPNLPPAPLVPQPTAGYVTNLPPYRIQIGDVLAVRLLLNPELNEDVTVRPDGY